MHVQLLLPSRREPASSPACLPARLPAARVVKELLAGEPSTRLDGAAAIDVPALSEREYKLGMYSYTQARASVARTAHTKPQRAAFSCCRHRLCSVRRCSCLLLLSANALVL